MRKISLKNVNDKSFMNLIKRSSCMDKMIFTTVKGSEFESIAYNPQSTALKSVEADLEKICENYVNECGDEVVKIQFADASILIAVMNIVSREKLNITFSIGDDNFARKVCFENDDLSINVSCADKDAVDFLTLSEDRRARVIDDNSNLRFSVNMAASEFSFMKSLFTLNKESHRVFFHKKNDELYMSEIETGDENVRNDINEIIQRTRNGEESAFEDFANYEKMYNKKLGTTNFENFNDEEDLLSCFNKNYFDWIDNDKEYTFSFHRNRVNISSFNEEDCIKTTVVLSPVVFA